MLELVGPRGIEFNSNIWVRSYFSQCFTLSPTIHCSFYQVSSYAILSNYSEALAQVPSRMPVVDSIAKKLCYHKPTILITCVNTSDNVDYNVLFTHVKDLLFGLVNSCHKHYMIRLKSGFPRWKFRLRSLKGFKNAWIHDRLIKRLTSIHDCAFKRRLH